MTWLTTDQIDASADQKIQTVVKNALVKRLPPQALVDFFQERSKSSRTSSWAIASVLLGFRSKENVCEDPRLIQYIKLLLQRNVISTADMLLALLDHSEFAEHVTEYKLASHRTDAATLEEQLFNVATQVHLSGDVVITPQTAHNIMFALARWLQVVNNHVNNKQLEAGGLFTLDTPAYNMYEALASAVLTILTQPAIRSVLKQPWWKTRRSMVVNELETFDLHVLQWMRSQLAGRLQTLTRLPPFMEMDTDGRPIFTDQQVLESVSELPVVHARAGLYVWLNACLCGRPFTDDLTMLGHLQARYAGDQQTASISLIMASFDILTNCLLRTENRQNIQVIRSFICNKLPLLLSAQAGFIPPPATIESCVQLAFLSIPMDALPPISAGATNIREMLKKVRLEFLQACALHGLILASAIETVTQEPVTASKTIKLVKENLLAQFNNNISKLETFMENLSSMEGNAGAISSAVIDLINTSCLNKDTMSLKAVCNILTRKLVDMDIIMQYTQPAGILLPLLTVLNEWVHDQDQAEFTPSYEEFASILLFALALIHRYDIDQADLGMSGSVNVAFQLLQNLSASCPSSELSPEQSDRLAKWVEGLFSIDDNGEMGGISDDVMRQCPPRDFYMLVPTLFEQCVLACRMNVLTMKALKGGLELLLEPFLLPSLLSGLSWIVNHSWEDHGDADILLQMLEKLLKPSSSSQDTQAMHRAIVRMVADPLVQSLQVLLRKQPSKKIASGLIDLLKNSLNSRRTNNGTKAEIDEWTSPGHGGFVQCVRTVLNDLVVWTSSVGPTPPTSYTHVIFSAACNALGANAVLDALVLEIGHQTADGKGSMALDIATSIVCSPVAGTGSYHTGLVPINASANLSLRDALRLVFTNVQQVLDKPVAEAEVLIRLHRRVEAQSVAPEVPDLPITLPMPDHATDQMMQDLGLTDDVTGASQVPAAVMSIDPDDTNAAVAAVAAAAAAVDFDLTGATTADLANLAASGSAMQIDQSQDFFGDLGLDMGASQPLSAAGNQTTQEEDIFAGLDMGDLGDDFTFS